MYTCIYQYVYIYIYIQRYIFQRGRLLVYKRYTTYMQHVYPSSMSYIFRIVLYCCLPVPIHILAMFRRRHVYIHIYIYIYIYRYTCIHKRPHTRPVWRPPAARPGPIRRQCLKKWPNLSRRIPQALINVSSSVFDRLIIELID